MKILVFGKTGQVATELNRQANVITLDRAAADLSDPNSCSGAINTHQPDVVINAAAYTAVDKAESEPELAHAINALAPAAMAVACSDLNIPLLHISTDYVFRGDGTAAWVPSDATDPQNTYGASKLAGEAAIHQSGCRHAILRTSWVFSAHGNNFVKTMLRISEARDCLNVVADQIGGPTAAADIASALLRMAPYMRDGHSGGTYHFSGAPNVSWADFAREIFKQAGRSTTVNDIPTSEYPTPAKRPLNSRLDCASLASNFEITSPDWRASLSQVLSELKVI